MIERERQQKLGAEKVVQYLSEAHAMELAMVQALTAHVAITPRSPYRAGLERHLKQTRGHAERVERRLEALGAGRNPVQVGFAAAQATIGQVIATAKAPVDVMRGASAAEKLLKNARDEAASEQLEIVTYISLQRLAEAAGDVQTARLAASIRGDEEKMQTVLHEQVRVLTEAVVQEQVRQEKVFDLTTIGAADQVRRLTGQGLEGLDETADEVGVVTRNAVAGARRTAKAAGEGARQTARTAARGATRTAATARTSAKRTGSTARGAAKRTGSTARGAARRTARGAGGGG